MVTHSLLHTSRRPTEDVPSQLFKEDSEAYSMPILPQGSGKKTKSEGELHNSTRASES